MGVPLIGYNVVLQVSLLSEALSKFTDLVVKGMVPNVDKMRKYAESSPSLITVISPVIGYDKATEIGRRLTRGLSIREALRELGYTDEQINDILSLEKLIKPGFPIKS